MTGKLSKKFGQFRQWTGERLGTVEKTNESDEFRRLDLETESRREGVERLAIALIDYAKTLDKRSSQDKNISAIAMLAKAMIQQGNFHGDSSPFGLALKRIGETEDQIQGLQEEFAENLRHGLLTEAMALQASMKDYSSLKKKLENRRLDYDAKLNKFNKMKKEKPGLEEEMKTAQKKYNETLSDMEELMSTFAEREETLLTSLLEFSQSQYKYFQKSFEKLEVLQGILDERELSNNARNNKSNEKAAMVRSNSRNGIMTILPPELKNVRDNSKRESIGVVEEVAEVEQPQPISNVERKNSIRRQKNNSSTTNSSVQSLPTGGSNRGSRNVICKVKAKYDFEAENEGEMSISREDVIMVMEKIDEGWWYGRKKGTEGKEEEEGIFPANYVEVIKEVEKESGIRSVRSSSTLAAVASCASCECSDFSPNVFKPKSCNNCFHIH